MDEEIIPARRLRALWWVAGITASMLIAATGVATAAIRYDARFSERVMPGVTVGGIAIGGMSFEEARARLSDSFEAPLDAPITIDVAGESFTVTPRDLGMTSDVASSFEQVVALSGGTPLLQRVWYRLAGDGFEKQVEVSRTIDEKKVATYVADLATAIDVSPRDARPELVNGELVLIKAQAGFKLDRSEAETKLKKAALDGETKVALDGEVDDAQVDTADIKDVIVVKVGENKLFHYRSDQLVKVYDVATGLPRYPTPRGTFKIVNKRFRPTWVNPAKYPGGWGANLPAKIGPGPGNPLGTRAMDLNSPGIRIHGSSAVYSMGYNASHGCIRMKMADVEELFGLVEVGTPVLIVQTAPFKPLPSKLRAVDRNTIDPNGPTGPASEPPPSEPPSPQPSPTTSPLLRT